MMLNRYVREPEAFKHCLKDLSVPFEFWSGRIREGKAKWDRDDNPIK